MQPIRTLMTTLLATSLGSLAYARPPALAPGYAAGTALQQDEPKPQQDEQKKKDDEKKKETPDNKSSKAEKQDKTANQQKTENSQKPKDEDQRQVARQDQRENGAQKGNGGQEGKHGRIADKDYQAHFGQQHTFNVRTVVTTTTIVPNQTRFVYTGYTFVFVDPWPAGWAMGDDCYIDYIDGEYVLIDVAHPGVQIALTIVA